MYLITIPGGIISEGILITKKGDKKAEEIKIGDSLMSSDNVSQEIAGIALTDGKSREKIQEFTQIELENKTILKVFGCLAFYILQKNILSPKWSCDVKTINIGDKLLGKDKKWHKVITTKTIKNIDTVFYCFALPNDDESKCGGLDRLPTFYLNNILFGTVTLGNIIFFKKHFHKDSIIYKHLHKPLI